VRRTIGLVTAGTVLTGHLLARQNVGRDGRVIVAVSVVGSALAGALVASLDRLDATARKTVVETAVAQARRIDPAATVWHTGFGGFQFYAERCGAREIVPALYIPESGPGVGPRLVRWPDEAGVAHGEPTPLRPGDWVIAPDRWTPGMGVNVPEAVTEVVGAAVVRTAVPFDNVGYHGGYTPVERFTGPRAKIALLRVTRPYLPYTTR
jgi:hypothetical protein